MSSDFLKKVKFLDFIRNFFQPKENRACLSAEDRSFRGEAGAANRPQYGTCATDAPIIPPTFY